MIRPDGFDGPVPNPAGSQIEEDHLRKLEILEFWHRQFKMDRLPALARSNQPALLQSSYRLIREICRIKGILDDASSLCDTLELNPNPWATPVPALANHVIPGWEGKFPILQKQATPIYPPMGVPAALNIFYEGLQEASQRLHLHLSPEGEIGLRYLLDRDLADSGVWPDPLEILTFESRILHDLVKAEMTGGLVEARNFLVTKGFMAWEIGSLMRGAREMAINQFSLTQDEARVMIVLRLEEIIRRSKDLQDIRAEIQAIKLMALILGLGRGEVPDDVEEMTEIVKKVSALQNKKKEALNG